MVGSKVLIFFRHTYYLQVPFVNGNPETAWEFDPAKTKNLQELIQICRRHQVRWVVKVDGYPPASAALWGELEARGLLVPIASAEVDAMEPWRIYGRVRKVTAVLLELRNSDLTTSSQR